MGTSASPACVCPLGASCLVALQDAQFICSASSIARVTSRFVRLATLKLLDCVLSDLAKYVDCKGYSSFFMSKPLSAPRAEEIVVTAYICIFDFVHRSLLQLLVLPVSDTCVACQCDIYATTSGGMPSRHPANSEGGGARVQVLRVRGTVRRYLHPVPFRLSMILSEGTDPFLEKCLCCVHRYFTIHT